MRLILTALIFLGGILFIVTGADFLFRPEDAASGFGVAANSNTGVAAIRGDMTAFFAITGLSMLYGAWKRRSDILLIPAFMLGVALVGRLITLITHGSEGSFFTPMIVEAVFVTLCLIAARVLPNRGAIRNA
ncbi:MAG: DUF4345 family protein [Pontixanthobacter sp.]